MFNAVIYFLAYLVIGYLAYVIVTNKDFKAASKSDIEEFKKMKKEDAKFFAIGLLLWPIGITIYLKDKKQVATKKIND